MKKMKKLNHTCKQRIKMLNVFLKRCIIMCIDSQQTFGINSLVEFLNLERYLDRITNQGQAQQSPGQQQGLLRTVSFAVDLEEIHETEERATDISLSMASQRISAAGTAALESLSSGSPRVTMHSISQTTHSIPSSVTSSETTVATDLSVVRQNMAPQRVKNSQSVDCDTMTADENDFAEEVRGRVRWGWVVYVILMLLCFFCAMKYGPVFIFFDPFDLDK